MLRERKVVAINNKPVMGRKKKNKKNLLVLYMRQESVLDNVAKDLI